MDTIKKKTVKRVVSIIILLLVAYGAYKLFAKPDYPEINTPKPAFGNVKAAVHIIEFSDLQCPACKAAHPMVEQIKNEFGDTISFQYYHFPLRTVHPYAQKAAEAVECANDQGKFWEYIDAAFAQSPSLQNKNLKIIATQLGLDTEPFDACLDSGAKRKVVEGDLRLGGVRDVQGTPTFFINNRKVENWNTLRAEIERELNTINRIQSS